jgi:putative ABC transport system ATP-binding protein
MQLDLVRCSKRFAQPDGSVLEVLADVDLSIAGGDVVAVLGRSGSGKSTLLNVLGLLTEPSGGSYLVDGTSSAEMDEAERCGLRGERFGFVFQDYVLMERRTALENVAAPLLHAPAPLYRRRAALALDMLARVGLADRARSFPWQLSGGQQQRVAVARALVRQPDVILADEPTGSLDVETGAEVLELLLRLSREEGCSLVLVTHDERLSVMAERRLVVERGTVRPLSHGRERTTGPPEPVAG